MMTALLLLYAYCSGIYSSRRIAKACGQPVDCHERCAARCARFPHHIGFPQAPGAGADRRYRFMIRNS
jgi:hypothetical protein